MSEMQRPMVGVALCVRRGDQVLIHKRKGNHAPGTWAFPGGHLEIFEHFEQAALRELAEEAGPVTVRWPRLWTCANTMFFREQRHYVVVFMHTEWLSGEPVIMEPEKCEEWRWCDWDKLPEPLMEGLQILKLQQLALPSF